MKNKILNGKNTVITGCARGIGLSILEKFAKNGSNIWACARKKTPEFELKCSSLSLEYKVKIIPTYFDITNKEEMKSAVKAIMQSDIKVNTLINNAGITYNALFQMTTESDIRSQMEVNFFAPYFFTQNIAKLILRNKGGSIINIASSAALDGNPGRSAYGASKAALICATRSISRELGAQGIRANVIAPGITETDMIGSMTDEVIAETIAGTDLRRIGSPNDIADVATFLASDLSSYITGQVLRVDGGM